MTSEKVISEKRLLFEKASKRAAWFTLIGLVLVAGSLGYSAYRLRKLNREIDAKTERSKMLDIEIEQKEQKIADREKQVSETQQAFQLVEQALQKTNPQVADKIIKDNPEIQRVVNEVRNSTVPTQTGRSRDLKTATAKEREGFQALIAGDYDRAISAFQAAEAAYNSFHNVYELARVLRRNKTQMGDPAKKKEVFQLIVKNYGYGAPPDLWPQVVRISNS